MGLEMAAAVFLGAFLGYQIDTVLSCRPIGLVVGVVLGAAAGMWNLIKKSTKNQ